MDIRSTGNIVQPSLSPAGKAPIPPEPSADTTKAVGPTQTAAAVPEPAALPSPSQLQDALKEINKALREQSQGIEFTVDKDSHQTIVKVVDQQTKEVIRQMPSKEAVEIAKALDRMQGLLLKQKA